MGNMNELESVWNIISTKFDSESEEERILLEETYIGSVSEWTWLPSDYLIVP